MKFVIGSASKRKIDVAEKVIRQLFREASLEEALRNALIQIVASDSSFYKK